AACRASPPSDRRAPPAPPAASGAPLPQAAPDGATAADPLAVLLEAAESDLERPYPVNQPESWRRYEDAARAILHRDVPRARDPEAVARIVAAALGESSNARVPRALQAWASNARARPRLPVILGAMRRVPDAAYIATCEAVLGDPALASDPGQVSGGAFGA